MKENFVMVANAFVRDGNVPPLVRLGWIVLRSYAWATHGSIAKISVGTFAGHMGVSERTAQRLLRDLERRGLIKAVKHIRGGRSKATHYRVLEPETIDVAVASQIVKKHDPRVTVSMPALSSFSPQRVPPMSPEEHSVLPQEDEVEEDTSSPFGLRNISPLHKPVLNEQSSERLGMERAIQRAAGESEDSRDDDAIEYRRRPGRSRDGGQPDDSHDLDEYEYQRSSNGSEGSGPSTVPVPKIETRSPMASTTVMRPSTGAGLRGRESSKRSRRSKRSDTRDERLQADAS